MTTKKWALILGAVLILCAGISIFLLRDTEGAAVAEIYSDGELVKTVALSVDQEFTVESAYGTNVITVRDGKIAVTQATCPDHYCMERGFCSGGTMIVCLPNKLVIQFGGESELDGVVG